jgi:hypothetical protein
MNSFSLYCRQQEPPITIDFSKTVCSSSRQFEIILYPENRDASTLASVKSDSSTMIAYPSHWTGGYFAMRNYLVPPGTRVVTPHVQSIDNKSCIDRLPQVLYAGNTGIKSHDLIKLQRVLVINTAVIFVNSLVFQITFEDGFVAALMGIVLFRALYALLFVIGKKGLVEHFATVCPRPNELFFPDAVTASKVSQPSKEHKYWVMRYDLPVGEDILVSARIQPNRQKYWSLVVYDEYGLPLAQYVNDLNVQFHPSEGEKSQHAEYDVRIRMTRSMPSSQYAFVSAADGSGDTSGSKGRVGYGYMDVSGQSKGYVLFRIVHPVDEDVAAFSAPRATVVKSLGGEDEILVAKKIK